MAFEVFDDVAFYWFLFSVMVMVIVPMSYSFLSTLQLRPPADWTRQLDSCKAAAPPPARPPAAPSGSGSLAVTAGRRRLPRGLPGRRHSPPPPAR